jgi:hypothetical protein
MVSINYTPTLAPTSGAQVTPEMLALRQEYAKHLLAGNGQPIHSWSEGVANMVDALVGGTMARKANDQSYAMRQQAIQQMSDALQGGASPAGDGMVPGAPSPQASALSSPDTSSGLAALPMTGAAGGAAPAVTPPAAAGAPDNRRAIAAAMNPFLPEGMQGILLQQAGFGAPTEAMKEYQYATRQGFKGSMLDYQRQKSLDMPTDVMKEYQQARAQGFKGTMLDYQTQKSLASRPVTNVDVNTAGETAFSSEYGKGRSAVASDIVDAGDKAASNLQKSNLLAHLLPQVATGKAAGAFSTLGGWLQSLGMDPAAVGIDPKLPATAEAVNGLANEMILGKIGKGQFPANNFSEQDRNFLLTTIPQLSDRPEAANIKLEVSRRLDELAIHRADEWEKIANDPSDKRPLEQKFSEFSHDWRDYLQKQDVFAGLDDQLKALGAPQAAAAPAATAAPSVGAPQPGEVREGKGGIQYQFTGRGDWHDPANWKPVTPPPARLAVPNATPPAAAGVYPFMPSQGPL